MSAPDQQQQDSAEMLRARLYATALNKQALYETNVSAEANPNSIGSVAIPPPPNTNLPRRVRTQKGWQFTNMSQPGADHYSQLNTIPTLTTAIEKALKPGASVVQKKALTRPIVTDVVHPSESAKILADAPPGSFFYMSRFTQIQFPAGYTLSPDADFHEWDILVCPYEWISKSDYYTISAKGVTHFVNGMSQFSDLNEWLHDLVMLQTLRKIPIFANFRLWKPLRLLKKAVLKNRRTRAYGNLDANLFYLNPLLRQALYGVYDNCINIKSFVLILTDEELEALKRRLKMNQHDDGMTGYSDDERTYDDEAEPHNGASSRPDSPSKAGSGATRHALRSLANIQTHNYPFSLEEFERMYITRCRDMAINLDEIVTHVALGIRKSISGVILAAIGSDTNTGDDSADNTSTARKLDFEEFDNYKGTIKKAATMTAIESNAAQAHKEGKITYTERATRLNLCKRMVSFLRLADFMIMDSLYDLAYLTLTTFFNRLHEASKIVFPTYEQVVPSMEVLRNLERIGVISFNPTEEDEMAGFDGPGGDPLTGVKGTELTEEDAMPKLVGDGSHVVFLGRVVCMLSTMPPAAGTTALNAYGYRGGYRNLMDLSDPSTPGDAIKPGSVADISVTPSFEDFYRAIETMIENILSVETAVRRLVTHEDFSDVTSPFSSGGVLANATGGDASGDVGMSEIQAPDISLLFSTNPAFHVVISDISTTVRTTYDEAVNWMVNLQSYFDAFNDVISLDIDALETSLLVLPPGVEDLMHVSIPDILMKMFDYGKEFLSQDAPQVAAALSPLDALEAGVDFDSQKKEKPDDPVYRFDVKAAVLQLPCLPVTGRRDIPLTSYKGLTRAVLVEHLYPIDRIIELVNQLEEYRLLTYAMPTRINLGSFAFDLTELKSAFMPAPQRVLAFLQTLIPLACHRRLSILILNMMQIQAFLVRQTQSVDEFIIFKECLSLITEEIVDNIRLFSDNIFQLVQRLTNNHGFVFPNEFLHLQNIFTQYFEQLRNTILSSEQLVDQQLNSWIMALHERAQKIKQDLAMLTHKTTDPLLNKSIELCTLEEITEVVSNYIHAFEQDAELMATSPNPGTLVSDQQANEDASEPSHSSGAPKDNDITQSDESSDGKENGDEQQYEDNTGPVRTVTTLADRLNALTLDYILQEATDAAEHDTLLESQTVINDGAGGMMAAVEASQMSETGHSTVSGPVETETSDASRTLSREATNHGVLNLSMNLPGEIAILSAKKKLVLTSNQIKDCYNQTLALREKLSAIESAIRINQRYQTSLGTEVTVFADLESTSQTVKLYDSLWGTCFAWVENMIVFAKSFFFGQLDVDYMTKFVAESGKIAFQCERQLPQVDIALVLKLRVNDFRQLIPIVQSLDNQTLKPRHWASVGQALGAEIPKFGDDARNPIKVVRRKFLTEKERERAAPEDLLPVTTTIKVSDETPKITIAWLIQNDALNFKDELSSVSNTAANEASLEVSFRKLESEWANIDISTNNYKDSLDIFVITDVVDLIAKLDDSILVLSGIVSSRYVKPIQEEVQKLYTQLTNLSSTIDVWCRVQKGYLYLLNIFGSGDIQRQLPNETKMFMDLDGFWKKLLSRTQDYPKAVEVPQFNIIGTAAVIPTGNTPPLEATLKRYEQVLESIQKSLDEYLQNKRMSFARLYFLSDEELLDILSQSKNPHAIQAHIRKIFDSIQAVEFSVGQSGGLDIVAMLSEEGERVVLNVPIKARGSITAWLGNLEQRMRQTINRHCQIAVTDYSVEKRNAWILSHPAQCIICVSQIYWCEGIHLALEGNSYAGYGGKRANGTESSASDENMTRSMIQDPDTHHSKKSTEKTSPLALYVQNFEKMLLDLIKLIQDTSLTKLQRCIVTALATIDVHSRDTLYDLLHEKVTSITSFEFQKLLRYYWNTSDNQVHIHQSAAHFLYNCEYLGASPRLVITPLTDLCYLTLMIAHRFYLGGAPQGPAGTGKTETTKDLAKALAMPCIVFNCSESLDYRIMGRFFAGLSQVGAWICFDEFNRIDLEVLSVVASQVMCIQNAVKAGQDRFIFEGVDMPINKTVGIFITMNPGYAGRVELPDNLKALFRAVSMVVPDYSLIAEIILFSEGFTTAKVLSRKMVQLYKLSSEQLSQQDHYDFGMRAIKSVLVMAGGLRRKYGHLTEDVVLIRAMRDANLPKFTAADIELFMGIIQDLFPGVQIPSVEHGELALCIEQVLKKNNYYNIPLQVNKIVQLHETMQVRHGVMQVGTAKSGKTVCMRVLQEALGILRDKVDTEFTPEQRKVFLQTNPDHVVNHVQVYVLNPKSIDMTELYGNYNDVSGEWKDGLVGVLIRDMLAKTAAGLKDEQTGLPIQRKKQWICFDGPVDTLWIESLNTLLDDNKLICFANSERLKINEYISIVFEVENLKNASPATVSRAGMVYFSQPQGLSYARDLSACIVRWDAYVICWFNGEFDRCVKMISGLREIGYGDSSEVSGSASPVPVPQGCDKTLEAIIYDHFMLLIFKLFAIFVPIGMEFYARNCSDMFIPTNEFSVIQSITRIFTAILVYNRSMVAHERIQKQEELDKAAEENGLTEIPQAKDKATMDLIDMTLIVRFLTLQFVANNNSLMIQSSLSNAEKLVKIHEYLIASDEFVTCENIIKSAFLYAFIWSFATTAMQTTKKREEFDNIVRTLIETNNEQYIAYKATGSLPEETEQAKQFRPFEGYSLPPCISLPSIPNSGLIFDYYIDWQPLIDYQQKMLANMTFMSPFYTSQPDDQQVSKPLGTYQLTTDLFSEKASQISAILSSNDEAAAFLTAKIVSPQIGCTFSPFGNVMPKFSYDPKLPFFQIYVNTLDSVRYSHIIESLVKQRKPVLVTGNTGSGKSVLVNDLLATLDKRGLAQNTFINFSAASNSLRTQEMIESSLEKRRKTILGPVVGKIACIFVDDINMIAYDLFGSQQAVEFIRDLVDADGFYDRKEWFFKNLADTTVLAACAPAGGGRNVVSMRTISHFINFALPDASDEVLQSIFNSILHGHLTYVDTSDPQAQGNKFPVDVANISASAVRALIQIYQTLSTILRPTPSKIHYTFNLRDVSKVVQGVLRATTGVIKSVEDFASLFRHECLRVFADRTIADEDRNAVYDTIIDVFSTTPGLANTPAAKKPQEGDPGVVDTRPEDIWGNYMKPGTPVDMRVYEKGGSFNAVQTLLESYLSEYNTAGSKQAMNLVLFKDAVEHVSRIARSITAPRGSMLLVGFGGSGRKSLTRLAAFLCDCDLETIELRKGYGLNEFRDDLKTLFQKAGLENKNLVFMLDDSQILVESQLEDINNILNSGIVPNLFEQDELDKIMADTRSIINKEGIQVDVGNKDAVFRFFINRVRDNLHIVLCLSPSGDQFRDRLRTFPSLVTSLTIDWFKNWPKAALMDVANSVLQQELRRVNMTECYDISKGSEIDMALEEQRAEFSKGKDAGDFDEQFELAKVLAKRLTKRLAPIATEIHDSVERMLVKYYADTRRKHYVPPACYLELLSLYSELLAQRIAGINKRYYQLTTGVQKLIESKAQVETLQKEQEALAPELEVAAANSEKLIKELTSEKAVVAKMKEVAISEETIVKAQAQDTEIIAQDAQKDLDAAMPLLIAANKALDSLNSSDITEIKSFKQPPPLVKMVMEAICILVGAKPDWDSAKKVLSDTGFLKSLIAYDKDNVPDSILKSLKKYTTSSDFVPEKVEKQSLAAKSLCFWVIAIEKYSYTIREVEPKRQRLEAAKADLKEKMDALAVKQAQLKEVEDKLTVLEETFEKQNNEKIRLEQAMELTKARLMRAEQLTGALSDERERWIVQSAALKEQLKLVPGDVFLATCAIAYLGVFNLKYRTELLEFWHGLLVAYNVRCSPIETILQNGIFPLVSSDDVLLESWRSQGLPSDLTSTDNAVMITTTRRFPLILDPQSQALTWIKGMEKANNLMVLKPTQSGLLRIFENCVRSGIPVILDGVGEVIEPSLKPVIEREIIISAGRQIIMLNDSEVEWHPNFRLYLITKLANPSFSPEVHAKLTIINFTISTDALEDQLLQAVVSAEYPALEKKRIELTTESSRDRRHLAQLSNQILHELTNFQGSVLDNENLIRVLGESKSVSADIEAKEKQAITTRAEIARYYSIYRPISIRGALIYFIVSDMSLVEPMYLFALSYYIRLFVTAINSISDHRGDPESMVKRVEVLLEKVTYFMFSNISRGVFEKDKLVFAFLLATRILQIQGDIGLDDWSILCRGNLYADIILSDENRLSRASPTMKDTYKRLEEQGEAFFGDGPIASLGAGRLLTFLKALSVIPTQERLCSFIAQNFSIIEKEFAAATDGDALCRALLFFDSNNRIVQMMMEAGLQVSNDGFRIISILLLIKFFSESFMILAIPLFIEVVLGPKYSNMEPPKLSEIYCDSSSTIPIIFLLTVGADPLSQLQALAQQNNQPLYLISLGQGQAPVARNAIEKASTTGGWVFLQNGHLARSWMAELEMIVEALSLCETMSPDAKKDAATALPFLSLPPKPSFRLFISSMPVKHFPASVLQTSLKITTEPPTGLRNNIVRAVGTSTVDAWEAEEIISELRYDDIIPKPEEGEEPIIVDENAMARFADIINTKAKAMWKRLFYAIVFFHGILLERRKFGPQAFNVRYEFNDSDFSICVQSLRSFMVDSINEFIIAHGFTSVMDNHGEISAPNGVSFKLPWDAITFIFSKIHYGGRVTDSWDLRTLSCILTGIINDKVISDFAKPYDFIAANKKYTIDFDAHTSYDMVRSFAQNLPILDGTEVFNMSENSLVVFRQSESNRVIARILDISADCLPKNEKLFATDEAAKDSATNGETKQAVESTNMSDAFPDPQAVEQDLARLRLRLYGEPSNDLTTDQIVDSISATLLSKLPALLDIEKEAGPSTFVTASNGMMHCLSVVLSQEIERFNNLLRFLKTSLDSIRLAIKGLILLSVDLEQQYKSLALGRVPNSWTKLAYPSLKPLTSWFDDLIQRVAFMRRWLVNGQPAAFWMSGLYFPQGFITGVLQMHAREYKISVDSLVFDFHYLTTYDEENTDSADLRIETGVLIYGLYLDCGFFDTDGGKLLPAKPGILYPRVPIVHFAPVGMDSKVVKGYNAPIYKTSERAGILSSTGRSTNHIMPMVIPTDEDPDFFIRQGCAVLCQLND